LAAFSASGSVSIPCRYLSCVRAISAAWLPISLMPDRFQAILLFLLVEDWADAIVGMLVSRLRFATSCF
jgi:hypothetical protein